MFILTIYLEHVRHGTPQKFEYQNGGKSIYIDYQFSSTYNTPL